MTASRYFSIPPTSMCVDHEVEMQLENLRSNRVGAVAHTQTPL